MPSILCQISFGLALIPSLVGQSGPPPSHEAARRIAALRRAGIVRDASLTDALLLEIKNPVHPEAVFAARPSAGQLGAEAALTAMEEVRSRYVGQELGNFATAVRARLLAETAARPIVDPALRAQVKLDKLLKELSFDAKSLNAKVKEDLAFYRHTRNGEIRTAVFALRELADMIYRMSDNPLASRADAIGIDFTVDTPSQFKRDLAKMQPAVRLAWLINELANKDSLREEDYFLIQLTVDFGLDASRAAASKLINMKTLREIYKPMGFAALFRILKGVGDQNQAPILEPFLSDANEWVQHYAKQSYPNVLRGTPNQCRITY